MEKSIGLITTIFGILLSLPLVIGSNAQNTTTGVQTFHSGVDASPIEATIIIKEDQNKSASFQPAITTIRAGGEILIANSAASDHSVTSGTGPEDPMAGKLFNTDPIKPGAFVEYIPVNLKPGNYSFYSSADPQVKGLLIVMESK